MSRKITQTVTINASISAVFNALIKPSLIKAWWGASSAIVLLEKGGIHAVSWGENIDKPDYLNVSTIEDFEIPVRLKLTDYKYFSKDGPLPFAADFYTIFSIEKEEDNTRLTVENGGFPETAIADDFFQGCVSGWTTTLTSIKNTLEK